jgi:hypothetical protein
MIAHGQYEQRFYRQWMQAGDLLRFQISQAESDLLVLADRDVRDLATEALAEVRTVIEDWIDLDPGFRDSLEPVDVDANAPTVIREMTRAGRDWNVGPMAAVAGAVAEHVGRRLLAVAGNVIVENGGDVFARLDRPVVFRMYAGEGSPFSDRVGFTVDARRGLGVCTSSGVVGPSLSMGRADAVVALAGSATEADAAATCLANRIHEPSDVDAVVGEVGRKENLAGIIACVGDRIGFWGDLKLVRL